MSACIGEPISWLRLETYALGGGDDTVRTHLAACPACAACLDALRGDVVALPPLVAVAVAPRRRWWVALVPTFAVAAAIALLLVRRPGVPGDVDAPERRADVVTVKGIGEVVLGTVRQRGGTIREDVTTFRAGDSWKVVVTCVPGATTYVDVAVLDGSTVDYPLPLATIACGNRVVLPGAFTVTGDRPNRVCAHVSAEPLVRAAPRAGDPDVACVTLSPE